MTYEDFKNIKKQFTKDVNSFSKDVFNFFRKKRKELDNKSIEDVAENEFYNEIKKYDDTKNEILEKAYFSLFSYTKFSFPNRFKEEILAENLSNLEIIKDTKIYPYITELINNMLPRAIELLNQEKENERLTIYFGRRNELERALQTFKNEENKKVFDKYIHSLEKWEESKIDYTDKTLIINGKNCGKNAICGVKIGRGNKIHIMEVGVFFDKKLERYFIGCNNNTQWWNSDLIIIDLAENIPDEVKAYFSEKTMKKNFI